MIQIRLLLPDPDLNKNSVTATLDLQEDVAGVQVDGLAPRLQVQGLVPRVRVLHAFDFLSGSSQFLLYLISTRRERQNNRDSY